jgi:hypothetical protein
MVAQLSPRQWLPFGFVLVSLLPACDKVPLLAPTGSAITLSATSLVLPIGGSTDVVATVIESAGTPAHNGTLVTFSTTLGSIEPREARTTNGQVIVKLHAGSQSGVAQVRAISGGATSGEAALEISIGGAAAERVLLTANPPTLPPGGGQVQLTAIVQDAAGNGLGGALVTFVATAGVLSQNPVTSDQSGHARTTLTTDRETTVRASVAGKDSGEAGIVITVDPVPPVPVATISPAGPVTEGEPAIFNVSAEAPEGTTIRSVRVNWGDGTSNDLGAVSGDSVSVTHVYRRSGTFSPSVTATASNGQSTTSSTVVVVEPPASFTVTLTASTTSPTVGQAVTFTATTTPAAIDIEYFDFDFGDGTLRLRSGPITSRVYSAAGPKVVTVTAVAADGRTRTAQIEINVTP